MATSQKVLYIKKTHVGLIDKIMSAKNLFKTKNYYTLQSFKTSLDVYQRNSFRSNLLDFGSKIFLFFNIYQMR